jgi:hypothetical protein
VELTERVYAGSPVWRGFGSNADAAEQTFDGVISAIKRKDRAELLRLSAPAQGRDREKFDVQAQAFFQQFEVIQLVAVPRAYEFDGFVVFFVKCRAKEKTFFAPFAFVREDDGSFRFLPYRTDNVMYVVVNDWFNAPWGPSTTDKPAYCADSLIERATHRVSFIDVSATPKRAWRASSVFLVGKSLDSFVKPDGISLRVMSQMAEMRSAVITGRIGDLVRHMTREGGARLREWLASAAPPERDQYARALRGLEPFFMFNAFPLVVVYARSPSQEVRVMYFTPDNENGLLWTNSSHLTVSDEIFKKGPLYRDALLDKPFSNIAIKE